MSNPFFDNQDEIMEAFGKMTQDDVEKVESDLQVELAGRVPGAKVRCISNFFADLEGQVGTITPCDDGVWRAKNGQVRVVYPGHLSGYWMNLASLELVEPAPANEAKGDSILGEAWKTHPDPSGVVRAAHSPENTRLVWWYNVYSKQFIKSTDPNYHHQMDLDKGTVNSIRVWCRGRVFQYQGKIFIMVYWPDKYQLKGSELADIWDKSEKSSGVEIEYAVNDDGEDITSMMESINVGLNPKKLPEGFTFLEAKGEQIEADFAKEIDANYKGPSKEEIRIAKLLDPIRKDIIAYLKKHPIEYYLDRSDELQKDSIEQIVDNDYEKGYLALENEFQENNWDYQHEQEIELLREMASSFGIETDDEDDEKYIELSDLREEFIDYMEYGPGFLEQVIKQQDAHVTITLQSPTFSKKSNVNGNYIGVGVSDDVVDVIGWFKEIIKMTGGSLKAQYLYDAFTKTPTDEDILYDTIAIYGKCDLVDIVEYKRNPETKYLKIVGQVWLKDSNTDAASSSDVEILGVKEVLVRNIVKIETDRNENKVVKSTNIQLSTDKYYEPDTSAGITCVKNVPGFAGNAAKEIAKLPIYAKKLTEWFAELEKKVERAQQERDTDREEHERYKDNEVEIHGFINDFIQAQPLDYWLTGDSGAHIHAATQTVSKQLSKFHLSLERVASLILHAISNYMYEEKKRKEKEAKKAADKAAYDAGSQKKGSFGRQTWTDMYPEDLDTEETKESVEEAFGKMTPDDVEKVEQENAAREKEEAARWKEQMARQQAEWERNAPERARLAAIRARARQMAQARGQYSNRDLARAFVNNGIESGKGYGSTKVVGDVFYSYATPIAIRTGPTSVAVDTYRYSRTTSKQMSYLLSNPGASRVPHDEFLVYAREKGIAGQGMLDEDKKPSFGRQTPEDVARIEDEIKQRYADVIVTIHVPSLGPERQNSFWYDGVVARVNYKNREMIVSADGEIRATFQDDEVTFRNDSARTEAENRDYDDDDILNQDNVVFDNNNWFSIFFVVDGNVVDNEWDVYDSYDQAILAAKDMIMNDLVYLEEVGADADDELPEEPD